MLRTSIIVLLCLCVPAGGATIYVNGSLATGAANGSSWADAYRGPSALRIALSSALDGDEVWVAQGTYRPATPGGDRNFAFDIPAGVKVYGGFIGTETGAAQRNPAANPTILSGDLNSNDTPAQFGRLNNASDNSQHVVRILEGDADTTVDSFTIRAGVQQSVGSLVDRIGANVLIADGAGNLRNCIIENGDAAWKGSGVGVHQAQPVIEGCTFRFNTNGFYGAGMAIVDGSNATVRNCLFTENYHGRGGGIFVGPLGQNLVPVIALIEGCTFQNNHGPLSAPSGGGISAYGGTIAVVRCVFRDNLHGGGGGAIYFERSLAVIDRCDFINNEGAADGGGALHIRNLITLNEPDPDALTVATNSRFIANNGAAFVFGKARFVNCTFANNTLTTGFLKWPTLMATGQITLSNSIVWGNNDGGFGEFLFANPGGSYIVNRCIIEGWTGSPPGDVLTANPLFIDLDGPDNIRGTVDDDLHPQPGSPAIDAGRNDLVETHSILDLDGAPRITDNDGAGGAVVDLGAYEAPGVPPPSCPGDINGDGQTNVSDFNILASHFGQNVAPSTSGDLNGDGIVNVSDFNILAGDFGCS